MRVVTMAFLEIFFFLSAFLAFVTAALSHFWLPLSYLSSGCLAFCFSILIWMIPLNLNWSRSLYGHLMSRFFYFLLFTIACYALVYHDRGIILDGTLVKTWRDSFYFSVTTFTTLGYGDFRPTQEMRLITSLEALTGLAFVPACASMIWLYCKDRMWPVPLDQQNLSKESMSLDPITGVWKQGDRKKILKEEQERSRRFHLRSCPDCESDTVVLEKYYELLGRTTPLPRFRAYCQCGRSTSDMASAHAAAFTWNRRKRKKRTNVRTVPD